MERDFFTLAEGLSGSELTRVARELLGELEGRAPAAPTGTEESGESLSGSAARELISAARELRGALRGGLPAPSPLTERAAGEEPGGGSAAPGIAAAPSAVTPRRAVASLSAPAEEARNWRRSQSAEAASMLTAEAVSEAIRRDSRRYDGGYERY